MSELRNRLASLLEAEFAAAGMTVFVEGDNLHPAIGAWRTDARLDVYRWEGSGRWFPDNDLGRNGVSISIDSWDTMTACAKGLKVKCDGHSCMWEAYANE